MSNIKTWASSETQLRYILALACFSPPELTVLCTLDATDEEADDDADEKEEEKEWKGEIFRTFITSCRVICMPSTTRSFSLLVERLSC